MAIDPSFNWLISFYSISQLLMYLITFELIDNQTVVSLCPRLTLLTEILRRLRHYVAERRPSVEACGATPVWIFLHRRPPHSSLNTTFSPRAGATECHVTSGVISKSYQTQVSCDEWWICSETQGSFHFLSLWNNKELNRGRMEGPI